MPRFSASLFTFVLLAIRASSVLAAPAAIPEQESQPASTNTVDTNLINKAVGDMILGPQLPGPIEQVCLTMHNVDSNYGKICFALPNEPSEIQKLMAQISAMNNHLDGNAPDGSELPDGEVAHVEQTDMPFNLMTTMCNDACGKVEGQVDMDRADCAWTCMPILLRKALESAATLQGTLELGSSKAQSVSVERFPMAPVHPTFIIAEKVPQPKVEKRSADPSAALSPEQAMMLTSFIKTFSDAVAQMADYKQQLETIYGRPISNDGPEMAHFEAQMPQPEAASELHSGIRPDIYEYRFGTPVVAHTMVVNHPAEDETVAAPQEVVITPEQEVVLTVSEPVVANAPSLATAGESSSQVESSPIPPFNPKSFTQKQLHTFIGYLYSDDPSRPAMLAKHPEWFQGNLDSQHRDYDWTHAFVERMINDLRSNNMITDTVANELSAHNDADFNTSKSSTKKGKKGGKSAKAGSKEKTVDKNPSSFKSVSNDSEVVDEDSTAEESIDTLELTTSSDPEFPQLIFVSNSSTSVNDTSSYEIPDTVKITPWDAPLDEKKTVMKDTKEEAPKRPTKKTSDAASFKNGVLNTMWAVAVGAVGWMLL